MNNFLSRNLNSIIIFSFIIPILLVAFVSISHVTKFYELSNPLTWALYLSIGIEIAALSALAGLTARMGNFIYIPFGIVTLIQFIGNMFFSYSYIDETSEMFLDWIDMISFIFEPMGIESTDIISHKTILSLFSGGLLPVISLTFAHMLVVYNRKMDGDVNMNSNVIDDTKYTEDDVEKLSRLAGQIEHNNYSGMTMSEDELSSLEEYLNNINNLKFGDVKKINDFEIEKVNNKNSDNDVELSNIDDNNDDIKKKLKDNSGWFNPVGKEENNTSTEHTPPIKRLYYTKKNG